MGLGEYVTAHTKLPPSRVILWIDIELGGKPKWLPLRYHYFNAHKLQLCKPRSH